MAHPAAPFRSIACCLDPSPGSARALEEAVRIGTLCAAALTVVHVAEPPDLAASGVGIPDPGSAAEAARRWLDGVAAALGGAECVLLERYAAEGYPPVVQLDDWSRATAGYPPALVCSWAEATGCDLLVAGVHRGLVQRMLLGSFAGFLARHAPCAVLLVPVSTPPTGRRR